MKYLFKNSTRWRIEINDKYNVKNIKLFDFNLTTRADFPFDIEK